MSAADLLAGAYAALGSDPATVALYTAFWLYCTAEAAAARRDGRPVSRRARWVLALAVVFVLCSAVGYLAGWLGWPAPAVHALHAALNVATAGLVAWSAAYRPLRAILAAEDRAAAAERDAAVLVRAIRRTLAVSGDHIGAWNGPGLVIAAEGDGASAAVGADVDALFAAWGPDAAAALAVVRAGGPPQSYTVTTPPDLVAAGEPARTYRVTLIPNDDPGAGYWKATDVTADADARREAEAEVERQAAQLARLRRGLDADLDADLARRTDDR